MSKRIFWPLFRESWKKACSPENIWSSFRSTGYWPLNKEVVLSHIRRPTSQAEQEEEQTKLATPTNIRAIRTYKRAISFDKQTADIGQLTKALEQLAIRAEISEHVIGSLRGALIEEKKRRKRGKPMGLFNKEKPGEAQFFTPGRIRQVRTRNNELEEAKINEQLRKEAEKTRKALEKAQKEREKQEAREERVQEAARKRLVKQQEKEQRAKDREAKIARKRRELVERLQKPTASKKPARHKPVAHAQWPEEPISHTSRSGRKSMLPGRFR